MKQSLKDRFNRMGCSSAIDEIEKREALIDDMARIITDEFLPHAHQLPVQDFGAINDALIRHKQIKE